jgi:hypothetical protein
MTKLLKIRMLAALLCTFVASAALAQNPTATGTINATLINSSGLAIAFDSASGGVSLGASGSSAATLNFGTISAYGTVPAGVTRTGPSGGSFTVSTPFNIKVTMGGLNNSPNYTLTAQLAAAAPTGLTYKVDAVTLTTGSQTVQTNGTYGSDVPHTLYLQALTASPSGGGPAVGSQLTGTINFVATSN